MTTTAKRPSPEPCSIANAECRSPASGGYGWTSHRGTTARCFSCGDPCCTDPGCSLVLDYMAYGKKRICDNCQIDRGMQKSDESDD